MVFRKEALWTPPEISGWLELQGTVVAVRSHHPDIAMMVLQMLVIGRNGADGSLCSRHATFLNRTDVQFSVFTLKGSYLFCFVQSTSAAPESVVPLEYASLEPSEESKNLEKLRYTILINLHQAYEDYCTRCAYKLASGKQQIRVREQTARISRDHARSFVQEVWFSALSHAVLPSRLLIRELKSCGR